MPELTGDPKLPAVAAATVRERSANALVYYSNDAQVSHTVNDIQLIFGQLVPPAFNMNQPATALRIKQDVVVIMTLDQAEAVLQILSKNLARAKAKKATASGPLIEGDEDL